MKLRIFIFTLALGMTASLYSQAPPLASPVEVLQTMKTANKELIGKQEKTLELLEDLKKEAAQLKTFGKRS